jgi:hypothetical protein
MPTVEDVIVGAYQKSGKNNPGLVASESEELLPEVFRALQGLYSFATRLNPGYFAGTASVPYSSGVGGWPRPVAAEAIVRIEVANGTEVAHVPMNDRRMERLKPSVYSWGQVFKLAGVPGGPSISDTLTFFYAKRPDEPTTLSSEIDSTWNSQYDALLEYEVAIYLAIKDDPEGRAAEIAQLKEDRDKWAIRFAAFLEHESINLRRRFGQIQRINTHSVVPLGSLLAGGSAAFAKAA